MASGEWESSAPRERDRATDLYSQLPELTGDVGGTTADRLSAALEEAIIDGSLAPGLHLKADDLSRRYGVSMIPVRESLRSLQANGWVTIRPHHGAFVRQGDRSELKDLFETRTIIESATARLAALRRTETDLADLAESVERGFDLVRSGSVRDYAKVNADFHERVARAAHNQMLLEFQQELNQNVRFYFSIITMERIKQSVHEHEALVQAIADQLPDQAERLILAHIGQSGDEVSAELEDGSA